MRLVSARHSLSRLMPIFPNAIGLAGFPFLRHIMNEHRIEWNAATERWICIKCLRASDQQSKQDAERELSQFECIVPKQARNDQGW